MAEHFTADQVLGFLNDDFDISGGENSDFEGDGVYSYLSDAAAAIFIEDLNSSVGPDGIASGEIFSQFFKKKVTSERVNLRGKRFIISKKNSGLYLHIKLPENNKKE